MFPFDSYILFYVIQRLSAVKKLCFRKDWRSVPDGAPGRSTWFTSWIETMVVDRTGCPYTGDRRPCNLMLTWKILTIICSFLAELF